MMSTSKRAFLLSLWFAAMFVLIGCGDTSVSSPDETIGDDTGASDTHGEDTSTTPTDTSTTSGDTSTTSGDTSTTGGDTSTTGDTSATDTNPADTTPPVMLTGLHIEPNAVSLPTTLGMPTTAQLNAFRDYDDGTSTPATAAIWLSSDALVAEVDANGLVTATGDLPGRVTIEAHDSGLTATREVHVTVSQTSTGGTFDPTNQPVLNSGNFGPSTSGPIWEYPEHETMFPAGIEAPVLQWNGNGNTHFVLTLTRGTDVSFTVYTDTNTYQPTPAQWRALGVGYGEPIQLSLYGKAGLDAAADRNPADRELTIFTADATLDGSVYYWEINSGSIMRIDDGATEPIDLFADGQCRGCHTLSRDGSKLGFMYNGGGQEQAGLAYTNPVQTIVPNWSEYRWDFLAFDPSGNRAAAVLGGAMSVYDTSATAPNGLAKLSDVPHAQIAGRFATTPAWSPDGSTLAYIDRGAGQDWAFTDGHLMTMSWDPATETFGTPAPLLTATAAGNLDDTISYPTWSPDSKWLGVGIGPSNRDFTNMGISLVNPVTGAATALARGGNSGDDVFPSFSPFIEGGYYWLLFYSGRGYGHLSPNATCVANGLTCKQLWVMAIDADMTDGVDGSHPAFWLPGQDFNQTNITGYWAPSPCGGEAQGCATTSDCCDGLTCLPDDEGNPVCQADACALPGETCTTDADCCTGQITYYCLPNLNGDNVCQLRPN